MMLPARTQLYRYDLTEPPKDWSNDFHEYIYGGIFKNQIGAYFFFDKEDNCASTCKNETKFNGEYYLTKCETQKDVNLLDLCYDEVRIMLEVLYHKGIDICLSSLFTYATGERSPLYNISNEYQRYMELVDMKDKNPKEISETFQLRDKITQYICKGNFNFKYFGQLLTDFENGSIFKDLLVRKGYEGYIFFEDKYRDCEVKTYCFFDNSVLTSPCCKKITLS